MNNIYYVYIVYVDNIPRYVGKGKGDRWKHCTGGTSHCVELNRDFFLGKKMEVKFAQESMSEKDALSLEKSLIQSFNALYNAVHNTAITNIFETESVGIPVSMMSANYIHVSDDVKIEITAADKFLLCFLNHNIGKYNGYLVTSQSEIAKSTGLHYKHVGTILRKLLDAGVIYGVKQAVGGRGRERWIYTGVNTLLKFEPK